MGGALASGDYAAVELPLLDNRRAQYCRKNRKKRLLCEVGDRRHSDLRTCYYVRGSVVERLGIIDDKTKLAGYRDDDERKMTVHVTRDGKRQH